MGDSYIEELVKQKQTVTQKLLKVALIALFALFAFAGLFINPIFLIGAVVIGVVSYFVVPGLDLEFEYLYVNGELEIDKIMSKTKRKQVLSVDLHNMEIMAPAKSHELDYWNNQKEIKTYDCTSGLQGENTFALIINEEKSRCKIYFDPSPEMQKEIRRLFPQKYKTI